MLSDVLTSAAAAAGAPFANTLAVPPNPIVVVLVLDGLGWVSLRANADVAPFLTGLDGRPLTAGFPATTATSLASIGTGLPPAGHGLVGYTTLLPDVPEVTEPIRPRIGDVVAVSRDHTTVVRRRAERYLATMRGQHGARTDEEVLVPLLIHTT